MPCGPEKGDEAQAEDAEDGGQETDPRGWRREPLSCGGTERGGLPPWGSGSALERRQGMRADAWACVRALSGPKGLRKLFRVRSFEAKQGAGDLDPALGSSLLLGSTKTRELPWAKSVRNSKIKTICET